MSDWDRAAQALQAVADPDGRQLYVTDRRNNTVTTVDSLTNQLIRTLGVGTAPVDVEFGTIAYAAGAASLR